MKWRNIFKAAFQSILKNRMRSLLTSLGIIIGVGAVIVMVGIGQGSQYRIKKEIDALGANMLIIFPSHSQMGGVNRGAGSYNRFTLADARKLQKESSLTAGISAIVSSGGQIIGGDSNWNCRIYGVDPSYLDIRAWPLKSGSFFTDRDVRAKAKVAVIGQTVKENLFPDSNPEGERIRINNTPFTVIGVLSEKGQDPRGMDQDDVVLAPSTTVLYRLKGGQYISYMMASAISTKDIPAAQEELTQLLREAHKIKPGEDDDFVIRNQAEITEAASSAAHILTLLLGSIAAVSLLVGGIGIMNIMLVSVTERTREIGIRLAVGARESDILVHFLTEAVVLSLIGGIMGIGIAYGVGVILNHFTDLTAMIQPQIVMMAFGVSGAVGVFFGFYPAKKAARLNPIDALRHE